MNPKQQSTLPLTLLELKFLAYAHNFKSKHIETLNWGQEINIYKELKNFENEPRDLPCKMWPSELLNNTWDRKEADVKKGQV